MQPFNKYYPPDWTPDKGSVNKYVGKHPLGDRARKIDQGILVVRFELPFNIWCTGCENHIGKGVRYNAEKKKIGNYYTTPILQFRMKCHLCSQWIEIHTDPKNSEYVVVSGARKKVEEWDSNDNEAITLQDEETKEKLETDPMFRLEHAKNDRRVWDDRVPVLTQLQRASDTHWKDPYTRSQQLRKRFREEKKKDKAIHEKAEQLRDKHSLHIDLLPESESDTLQAKLADFADPVLVEAKESKLKKTVAPLFRKTTDLVAPQNNTVAAKLQLRATLQSRLHSDPFLSSQRPAKGYAEERHRQRHSLLSGVHVHRAKKSRKDHGTSHNPPIASSSQPTNPKIKSNKSSSTRHPRDDTQPVKADEQ